MDKYITMGKLYKLCDKVENIALDLDDTVWNSLKRDVEILNKRHNKNVDYHDITKWNFSCHFDVTDEEIEKIFDSKEFFNNVEFKPFAIDFINKYRDKIYFVSKGNPKNLKRKEKFLKKNGLGDILFVGVPINESKEKYIYFNTLFIDDNVYNLIEANCRYKILFETNPNADWQQGWYSYTIKSWEE